MIKKLLAGLLAVGLIAGLVLPFTEVSAAYGEVVELRDQYSMVIDNGDGSFSRVFSLGSIFYEDDAGNFQPINTTIVASDKPNWDYEVTTGHWKLFVNNDTTVGVKKGDNWIGTRFHGIAYLDVTTKDYTILQTTNNVTPVVTGNTITWYNILYGVDYVLHYTADSLKEDVVIHQEARDLLSSAGHRPSDYGYATSNTYLVPIFECDWSASLPMKLNGLGASPDELETNDAIHFEANTPDPYWNTKLVSFLPVYMATSVNPINPADPESEWEYAECVMKKRLIYKNDKHWLLTGVPVLELNAMPEGSIIFDPTETLRPSGTGDEENLPLSTSGAGSHYLDVDDVVADDHTTRVGCNTTYLRDLYNVADHSVGSGTIGDIEVFARCYDITGYINQLIITIKSGTGAGAPDTIGESGEITLSAGDAWQLDSFVWATNPATAAAWTWDEIDKLQIGINLRTSSGVGPTWCTQVYVVVDYTPPPGPTVTTDAADDLEDTTATLNGTVTDDGGEIIDYYGFVWDTGADQGDPGNADPSGPPGTWDFGWKSGVGNYGENPFDHGITGLPTGTTIYFRAAAHNTNGWAYGDGASFLTKPAAPANVSATDGDHTDKVVITWDDSTGATDYQVYRDGVALGWAGDVNTWDDNGADAGTVTPGVASASDGTSTAHSTLDLAGEGINDGTTHTYKVRAKNATGESDDSATNIGFRRPINLTYQWYRSVADVDGGYVLTGGATTDPYNDVGFPANGDGRWAYCEVNATGAVAQDSTHDRGFRAVAPTVTTIVCSGFALDWAIVNATVDTLGLPASVTEVGFDYGLTTAYGSSQTKTGTWAAGDEFWMKLTGLTPGTVYHYRAKAFNGVWGTGGDRVFSTEGSPTLYEYLNTGGDAVGDDIYAGNWAYMQFTVGTVAHSLDFANIYVIRTGAAPGNAVLSLRHADGANKPTGADLDIMTLNANNFSDALDWVKFDFPLDYTLEAGESYALVLRCPNGTVANYLEWRWVAAGGLANAIAGKSADSGITWTAEGTADYLFENWGEPVFEVVGAEVFTGYRETGDWLVVFTYRNYFTPYYLTTICRDNFYVRLIDDTTVIAQTGCPAWGYRPGSIYFSKTLADAMEWGVTDYKVRLYGDFGTNPYTDYNIAAADWGGAVAPFLDDWVIGQATVIGDDLGIALTETIADKGEVLNAIGHIWFSIGIPYLNEIRPELFEQVSQKPPYEEEDYTHALQGETDWEQKVGPQIAQMLTDGGNLIGVDGDEFGGVITFIAFIIVVALLTFSGHLVVGLGMGYPILLAGAWFGLLSWVIIGVITFLAVAIFVYKVWLTK